MDPFGGADLCLCSRHPDTSLHCDSIDTGLVHHRVYLFTLRLLLVLIPRRGGQAKLIWVVGYIRRWLTQPQRSCTYVPNVPIQVLTGPNIQQLC